MRLGWNLLAGGVNSVWTAAVGVLAIPFYLRYLGIESYGLIGFFTTLLTLLQMLDFGLSPTINREVAREAALGDIRKVRCLLRSLELVYWIVAIFLGALILFGAGLIGRYWLQSAHLPSSDVAHAVMLMGLIAAVRWPASLYVSTLMGAQRLAIASGINVIMVTCSAVGAVLMLAFVAPTIQVFFLWQAGVSLVNAYVMRHMAWQTLGRAHGIGFRFAELRRVWRFSARLSAVTMTGVILLQLDKILLSKMIGLGAYGRYIVASMLAGGLYLLVTPIFNALYPRFSALVAAVETERLAELYCLATRLLATFVFPLAMIVALFAEPLVRLWTRDAQLATQVAPIVPLLILGAALHGLMYMPYALQLAYGKAHLALIINIVLIAIYLPLIMWLSSVYAEIGAAWAWLLLHCFYLGICTWMTHRYLLKGSGKSWLTHDVGIPLSATLVVGTIGSRMGACDPSVSGSRYEWLLYACVMGAAAIFLSLTFSPALRSSLVTNLRSKSNRL